MHFCRVHLVGYVGMLGLLDFFRQDSVGKDQPCHLLCVCILSFAALVATTHWLLELVYLATTSKRKTTREGLCHSIIIRHCHDSRFVISGSGVVPVNFACDKIIGYHLLSKKK